jgi:hypothetical protein
MELPILLAIINPATAAFKALAAVGHMSLARVGSLAINVHVLAQVASRCIPMDHGRATGDEGNAHSRRSKKRQDLKNFGEYIAFSALVLYLGKEFIGWMWWRGEDDEDEPSPAPLLWASWPVFSPLDSLAFRIRWRIAGVCAIVAKLSKRRQPRWDPGEGPVDADGRTLE